MNAHRTILSLSVAVIVIALTMGVARLQSEPQISVLETTRIFFDYLRFGEYALAYNFLSADQQKRTRPETYYLEPPWGDNWWSIGIAVNEYQDVKAAPGSGREALQKVLVRGNASLEQKGVYEITLVLEPKGWKIDRIHFTREKRRSEAGMASRADKQADIPALMQTGIDFYHHGQLRKAISYFSKVLEAQPNNADAHAYMGMCYGRLAGSTKDVWKAIDYGTIAWIHHETALEINPYHVIAHLGRGQGLLFAPEPFGNVEKAMEDFRFVTQRDPNNEEAVLMVALAYKKNGDIEMARQSCAKALEINPDYQEAKDELNTLKQAGR